jgi:error-prone DNA polymerase
VLGITAVDPSRSNLLFERFLSLERREPPDIDIDFEHERREEVIQEIYARYGRERAAMVSEVISYRGKSALREVGKAFGLSLEQVDRLSGPLNHWDSVEDGSKRARDLGFDMDDGRLRKVIALARQLEGFPRHLSIHVGGFVLSARPLVEVAPVEPARMKDRTVIPWDKDDIEALGFFKVDVLGLGMLTAIRKCLAMIHADGALHEEPGEPEAPEFDPIEVLRRVPAEDPAVYALASQADTVGVFQIESRAQMAMLPRLRPQRFYDLVIEVAIVRPGPIQGGMVHPYLRRRNLEEDVVSPHPDLWPILERTLGVPLFQEQVMRSPSWERVWRGRSASPRHGRRKRAGDCFAQARLLDGFAQKGISKDSAKRSSSRSRVRRLRVSSRTRRRSALVRPPSWEKAHYPAHSSALPNKADGVLFALVARQRCQARRGSREVCIEKSSGIRRSAPGQAAGRAVAGRRSASARFSPGEGDGRSGGKAIEAARARAFSSLDDVVRRVKSAKSK